MHTAVDCLVTGATGFLGSLVVRLLLEEGASVCCLVRQMSRLGRVPDRAGTDVARLETIPGNLLSPMHVDRAVEGVRVVYHLAAESRGYPATIFAGTVLGSKNLLEAIVRAPRTRDTRQFHQCLRLGEHEWRRSRNRELPDGTGA